jgi:hypothetical protein
VNHVAAHNVLDVLDVEARRKERHVVLQLPAFPQVVREPLDRHIRDAEERVEGDSKCAVKLTFVVALKRGLLGRERGATRVVDEIEIQTRPSDAVPTIVELAQRGDGLIENAVTALRF